MCPDLSDYFGEYIFFHNSKEMMAKSAKIKLNLY